MAKTIPTARLRPRKREILHVENSAAEAELLRESLCIFTNITVTTVADGAEALAHLRDNAANGAWRARPDLVLLDLNLPYVDGRRVLAEIKSDAALRALPVIVLSSSALEEDLSLAYRLGANAYVVKPVEFRRYQAVVRAICEFWCGAAALPTRPFA